MPRGGKRRGAGAKRAGLPEGTARLRSRRWSGALNCRSNICCKYLPTKMHRRGAEIRWPLRRRRTATRGLLWFRRRLPPAAIMVAAISILCRFFPCREVRGSRKTEASQRLRARRRVEAGFAVRSDAAIVRDHGPARAARDAGTHRAARAPAGGRDRHDERHGLAAPRRWRRSRRRGLSLRRFRQSFWLD